MDYLILVVYEVCGSFRLHEVRDLHTCSRSDVNYDPTPGAATTVFPEVNTLPSSQG